MTPENSKFVPTEKLVLGSLVNRFCDIEVGDDFDPDNLVKDAQKIIDTFNPKIKVSTDYFRGYFGGGSSSFGSAASTNNGQFQTNVNAERNRNEFGMGQLYEDRIGLYKITKTDEGTCIALNFDYFMQQISNEGEAVDIGPLTHILYDKKNNLVTSVLKSKPKLLRFLRFNIVLFEQTTLWGKGKLKSSPVSIYF